MIWHIDEWAATFWCVAQLAISGAYLFRTNKILRALLVGAGLRRTANAGDYFVGMCGLSHFCMFVYMGVPIPVIDHSAFGLWLIAAVDLMTAFHTIRFNRLAEEEVPERPRAMVREDIMLA